MKMTQEQIDFVNGNYKSLVTIKGVFGKNRTYSCRVVGTACNEEDRSIHIRNYKDNVIEVGYVEFMELITDKSIVKI